MGEVIPFKLNAKSGKKTKLSEMHKGKTLCKSGFHKWVLESEKQFDVKFGKLVTSYRCKRCNVTKNSAT